MSVAEGQIWITADGGHLNELRRQVAAEELLHVLAEVKTTRALPA